MFGVPGGVFFQFLVSGSLQLFWLRKILPGSCSIFLLPAYPMSSPPLFPRGVSLQSAPYQKPRGDDQVPLPQPHWVLPEPSRSCRSPSAGAGGRGRNRGQHWARAGLHEIPQECERCSEQLGGPGGSLVSPLFPESPRAVAGAPSFHHFL